MLLCLESGCWLFSLSLGPWIHGPPPTSKDVANRRTAQEALLGLEWDFGAELVNVDISMATRC